MNMDLNLVAIVVLAIIDAIALVLMIYHWSWADTYRSQLDGDRTARNKALEKVDELKIKLAVQNRLIRIMALNDGIESPIEDDDDDE
jgi:hypothetical protein